MAATTGLHNMYLRRRLVCLVVVLVWFGLVYLGGYVGWYTPIPVYFLDKLNLRSFFLPNILCDNCTQVHHGYLLSNESACSEEIFLLNVVISFHANVVSRKRIRQTWGGVKSYRGQTIRTMFAFGIHEDPNFNNQLAIENEKYHDILQINMSDHYRKLTEKTITMFKWITKYCTKAKYILKTDDDSFNHVYRIVDYLLGVKQEKFIGGYCFTVTPDRRISSKYYVDKSVYPDVYYPTYCAGPGYIMSQSAAVAILSVYSDVTYIPMEDVYIAGMCRIAAGIMYTEIPGMIVGEPQLTKCDLATWAKNTHNVVPERMVTLWDRAMAADATHDCINRNFRLAVFIVIALAFWGRLLMWMFMNR